MNRIRHPRALAGLTPVGPRAAPVPVAQAAKVSVAVDPALGTQGRTFAQQVAGIIQAAYAAAAALCAPPAQPHAVCEVARLSPGSDGTGGAYHQTCSDTTLVCDASYGQPRRTAALFVAELVEVFEAAWNNGWNCGDTNGEGLSRAIAEACFPGELDDFSLAGTWLDTPGRPDWVSLQQGTDGDPVSVGCAVLFLTWLHTARGLPWPQIVAAGGATLAQCYQRLGLGSSAYADFRAACDARWPAGRASNVVSDNPWSPPAPAPSPPPPPAAPAPTAATVTLSAAVQPGTYTLTPSGPAHPPAQLGAVPRALLVALLERAVPLVLADAAARKPAAAIVADLVKALLP